MFRLLLLFLTVLYVDVSYGKNDRVISTLCQEPNVTFVPLKINPDNILRKNVPRTLFGFHHPWYDFQVSYFRYNKVNDDVLRWLKPFSGAVYRFPGGNDYDWQRAAGPLAQRKKIRARYSREGFITPYYGLPEFVDFIERVNGKAIIILNLVGPDGKLLSEDAMIKHNIGMVNWFRNNSAWRCSSGKDCPILYWELGNELDWPDTNWSAEQYISRLKPLIGVLKEVDPHISLAVLGKTAPWNTSSDSERFNQKIAQAVADKVTAVTLHPYYDGLPIPVMVEWMRRTLKPYQKINSNFKIVITEHGRWPTQKSINWSDDWYKASGSGGAISAVDFIISIISIPQVDVAAWHALSGLGPWQLFHVDKKSREVYPSAVYWGFLILRAAFLEDLIEVYPTSTVSADYTGGYGLHVIAMKDHAGHISLIGVNRSMHNIQLSLNVVGAQYAKVKSKTAKVNYLIADNKGGDNTDEDKRLHTMKTIKISDDSLLPKGICIPPMSIFSLVN